MEKITKNRNRLGHILYPKYSQYLALLFTEIYLDRYFRNPEELINSLNAYLKHFKKNYSEKELKPFEKGRSQQTGLLDGHRKWQNAFNEH